MTDCFIGLGSNLADPHSQLLRAIDTLRQNADIDLLACSDTYASTAIGPGRQPDYVNAVILLASRLCAPDTLRLLHHIEAAQGRTRHQRWGPRTLDLDLLLFGAQTANSPELLLPHPRLLERNFVLVPLLDIAPDLSLPDGTAVAPASERLGMAGLTRIGGPLAITDHAPRPQQEYGGMLYDTLPSNHN